MPPPPPWVFSLRCLRLYFPALESWVAWSVLSPGPPAAASPASCSFTLPHSTVRHLAGSASHLLALSPLRSSCRSPIWRLVWMGVFSLCPWLLDFHTVRFSVSSGCFLFLKLLLFFFWLCKEAQCVYLRLHLGRKSTMKYFK